MDSKKETTEKKKDSFILSDKANNQQAAKNKSESVSQGQPNKSNADTKDYGQKDKNNLKGSCCN